MKNKFDNRKIRTKSLIAAMLVCVAACLALCACNSKSTQTIDTSPCYDINLEYDAEAKKLCAHQETLYVAPADVKEIVLHIYANAFAADHNAIDILSAQINRQNIDFEIYGEDKTLLKLPFEMQKGDVCTLALKYETSLAQTDTRLGVTKRGDANLTCFYPVVAKYDGGWREDGYCAWGDPFYSDISSFFVRATVDEELAVASSGKIVETLLSDNGKKTVEIEARNIRDFGMAVGKFDILSRSIDINSRKIEVKYCYYDDGAPAESLKRAERALTVFSQTFGEYAHDSLTVVQSNLSAAGGMEYGSFVLVSPSNSRAEYLDTITHETAHQWWYDAVGSDQINSAWLDEGLTEFCTYYFHYLEGNRAEYSAAMASISRSYSSFSALKYTVGFDGTMNRPLSSYLTEGEYVAVTYLKGALLFDALRSLVGDKKFQAAMSKYYADNKYGIGTQQSLIDAFKSQGYDVASIVNNWTDDKVRM